MVVEDIVPELHMVNDKAERGVELMQKLNALLTKDEGQNQFAIHVISEHCKCYSDSKRETLVKVLDLLAHSNEKN